MFSFINGVSEGLFRIQDNVTSVIINLCLSWAIYSYILTIAVFNSCIDLRRCYRNNHKKCLKKDNIGVRKFHWILHQYGHVYQCKGAQHKTLFRNIIATVR